MSSKRETGGWIWTALAVAMALLFVLELSALVGQRKDDALACAVAGYALEGCK